MNEQELKRLLSSQGQQQKKLAVNHPALMRQTYGSMSPTLQRMVETPSLRKKITAGLRRCVSAVTSFFNVGSMQ